MTPVSSRSTRTGKICGKPLCAMKIKLDEDSLECEKCKKLFHPDCTNLTKEVYDLLKSKALLSGIIWCCEICTPQVRKSIEMIQNFENKLLEIEKKLNNHVTTIENCLVNIESEMGNKDEMGH